jgi:hypothetical protein
MVPVTVLPGLPCGVMATGMATLWLGWDAAYD